MGGQATRSGGLASRRRPGLEAASAGRRGPGAGWTPRARAGSSAGRRSRLGRTLAGGAGAPHHALMRAWRLLWLLVMLAVLSGAQPVRALDRTERRIVASVDRGTPAALALLERAVNVNSGTMNFEGVRGVGRMLEPEFAGLGFAPRWVDGAAWGRAGHLIATRPGVAGAPRVLLIGHLDTVFERDSPFQRFEPLTDSTARGPGVIDMKGGDVIILLALRSLAEAGVIDRLAFTVVLTGDEEKSGDPLALARRDLVEAADWADVAIGFEDGDGDPRHAV